MCDVVPQVNISSISDQEKGSSNLLNALFTIHIKNQSVLTPTIPSHHHINIGIEIEAYYNGNRGMHNTSN